MLYFMIMAGGIGSRMNSPELPKQYIKINNEPIIIKTIKNFTDFGEFKAGVICCPGDWIKYTEDLLNHYGLGEKNIYVISGGNNRNNSVKNGCRFLFDKFGLSDEDVVLTHDAVRPFINSRIIKENIETVRLFGAANTVMPVYDSVVKSEDGEYITQTVERKSLYRVQTPQSFNGSCLYKIINSLTVEELEYFTDVASIFDNKGIKVKLVKGDDKNIKITTPFDLIVAESILNNQLV